MHGDNVLHGNALLDIEHKALDGVVLPVEGSISLGQAVMGDKLDLRSQVVLVAEVNHLQKDFITVIGVS